MRYEPFPGNSRQVFIDVLGELGRFLDTVVDERPTIRQRLDGSGTVEMRLYDFAEPLRSSTVTLPLTHEQTDRLIIAFGL